MSSPHGARTDPYYWLRDDERRDADVLAYLNAENAYHALHRARPKPLEDKVYDEIIGAPETGRLDRPLSQERLLVLHPFRAGQGTSDFRAPPGSLDAPEEVMLDANELSVGHDYYQIGEIDVSPDSEWLAFCEDTVGRRQYRLRFKNLRTGALQPESIADVEPDIVWANDSRTVLYIEKDPETLLGTYVKKHVLGDGPDAGRIGIRADRHDLVYRRLEIQIRPFHLHPHGRHGDLGMALRGCG